MARQAKETGRERLRILLIEDDPQDAFLLRKALAEAGSGAFEVTHAERLSDGVHQLGEAAFDLVLLDLSLPDSRGLETLSRLSGACPAVPIVVLTGANNDALALQAVQAGAQDYLVKGQMDSRMLVRAIRYAIERHSLQEGLVQQKQEVEASEARLRKIIESHVDGSLVVDREGVVRFANRASEALLGRGREDMLDQPFGFPVVAGESAEVNILHPDKRMRVAEMRGVDIVWEGAPAWLISLRDITRQKQMEQELIHTQRLRAVGELAAGLSHNLNNILTGIMGPAQYLHRLTDDPAILQQADTIINSSERARDLIQQLQLSVRGKEENSFQPVSLDEIVREAVQAARPRWKDKPESRGIAIEVVTRLGETSLIRGTKSELHDIVINLLLNAVDALPEGGRITIETKTVEDGAQLIFSDTGVGMDEETRRRVFEPFFTTKMDVGSGLGLSTAHGTVERWGGKVEVESQPGKGTTFTFFFPAWKEEWIQREKAGTTHIEQAYAEEI